MFALIKAKATMIIWGLAITAFLSMSGAFLWKANQLERVELKLVNAEQTIVNKQASLEQLSSDILRQEQAMSDLNVLQEGYDQQIEHLNQTIAQLGQEIDMAVIIEDPIEKEQAITVIENKLDDEVLNSINCLMRASGDLSKICK